MLFLLSQCLVGAQAWGIADTDCAAEMLLTFMLLCGQIDALGLIQRQSTTIK